MKPNVIQKCQLICSKVGRISLKALQATYNSIFQHLHIPFPAFWPRNPHKRFHLAAETRGQFIPQTHNPDTLNFHQQEGGRERLNKTYFGQYFSLKIADDAVNGCRMIISMSPSVFIITALMTRYICLGLLFCLRTRYGVLR